MCKFSIRSANVEYTYEINLEIAGEWFEIFYFIQVY